MIRSHRPHAHRSAKRRRGGMGGDVRRAIAQGLRHRVHHAFQHQRHCPKMALTVSKTILHWRMPRP